MFDVVAAACAIQLVLFGAFAGQLFSTSSRRWTLLPLYKRYATLALVVLSVVAAVAAGFELLSSRAAASEGHAAALGTLVGASGLSTVCFDLALVLQARPHIKCFSIRLTLLSFTGLCATLACFGSIWAAVSLSRTPFAMAALASLTSGPGFLLATGAAALGDLLVGVVSLLSLPTPKNSSTSSAFPMPSSPPWVICLIVLSTASAVLGVTARLLSSTTLCAIALSLRILETPIYGLALLTLSAPSPRPLSLLNPSASQLSSTSPTHPASPATHEKQPQSLTEVVIHPFHPSPAPDFTAGHKQRRSTSAIDDRHLRSLYLRPSSLVSATHTQEERRRKRLSRERFEGHAAQMGVGLERARSPPYLSSVSWGGRRLSGEYREGW